MRFDDFPPELHLLVAGFLDRNSLFRLRGVSHYYKTVAEDVLVRSPTHLYFHPPVPSRERSCVPPTRLYKLSFMDIARLANAKIEKKRGQNLSLEATRIIMSAEDEVRRVWTVVQYRQKPVVTSPETPLIVER